MRGKEKTFSARPVIRARYTITEGKRRDCSQSTFGSERREGSLEVCFMFMFDEAHKSWYIDSSLRTGSLARRGTRAPSPVSPSAQESLFAGYIASSFLTAAIDLRLLYISVSASPGAVHQASFSSDLCT